MPALWHYLTMGINAHLRYRRERYGMGPTAAQYMQYRSAMRMLKTV